VTPDTAMVLAAGKGTRMAPLTDTLPKPLVHLMGKPLIDHALFRLDASGIGRVIVNVHYLADKLEAHLREWTKPEITISDERAELLETGGGTRKALPLIGARPFYLLNSDSVWFEAGAPALSRLSGAWGDARMDALLLIVPLDRSSGYAGRGDFVRSADGLLTRLSDTPVEEGYVYMGTAILHPRLFANTPSGAFSLNLLFDRAIRSGKLYGLVHDGDWMHVGTPDAIGEAEARLKALGPEATAKS
jgi:N-acetyl-alpha-D-muramate 1-phosphate uridylyltransferase